MDGRHADEYHGARVAPVAQLDRVLPSEGRGRGFESRLVHHLLSLVQGNRLKNTFLKFLTKHLLVVFSRLRKDV